MVTGEADKAAEDRTAVQALFTFLPERRSKTKERMERAFLKEIFWPTFKKSLKIRHPNGVAAESQQKEPKMF